MFFVILMALWVLLSILDVSIFDSIVGKCLRRASKFEFDIVLISIN